MVARLVDLVSVDTPVGDAAAIAAAQRLLRSLIEPVLGAEGERVNVDETDNPLARNAFPTGSAYGPSRHRVGARRHAGPPDRE